MNRVLQALKPYFGTKAFYRTALSVMLPVTVQQLINNMFNMVDNVMVGSLDVQGLAMSAVSVANKPYVIFSGIIFGLMGAGGLLISQYYGAKEREVCNGLFWLELWVSLICSSALFAVLYFAPEWIMRIFVTDPRTIELGVRYLKIVCFSYFPAAISSTCIFSLRSIGQNRSSMLVSLASMGVNAVCNYALIFGKLGFSAMGVEGAAIGTLIARLFEMLFYVLLMLRRRMYFTLRPFSAFSLLPRVKRAFTLKAAPLIFNELLFAMGINIFFWCYARLDEASLPALTIAELCYQVCAVIAMGNSSAVSVMIGTELGAGELDKARENSKKQLMLSVMIGLVCVLMCCGLAQVLPYAYNVSPELRAMATKLSCIMAIFAPANFVYGCCFFCLRAGGDTRSAMLLDSGYMWLVPVPACFVMALGFVGRIPLTWAVLLVQLLSISKVFLALRVLRQGKWVRNITLPD